ncbi:MAG: hypothetical protein ACK559_31050, partial [bacterium]
ARLELISRVLGGPNGIFARADGAALNYLGNAILKRVSDVCEMDDRWKGIGSLQFRNATPSIELAFYPALNS